jgi:1,4-alpha-glucan branching enzyme
MRSYLALVLHAHLPFVRHPEHERFLEENWLFEAITECYVPLLQVFQGWARDGMRTRLTLTLTPTLCSMLQDPLLQSRYRRYLENVITLCEKEVIRTHWEPACNRLAEFYLQRVRSIRGTYAAAGGNLVAAFRVFQEGGYLEIITSAATHALLPLLATHPSAVRAQIRVACDHYRSCFGRDPVGIWLPECAYVEGLEDVLAEAGLRWFITETHALLHARPRPRYAFFAPVITGAGVAAFGRDHDSAKQVWSRHEGYPGDPRYRDFYRDIGFDLDLDYLKQHLPAPGKRSFTGIKYHRITGPGVRKELYEPATARAACDAHAAHFLSARTAAFEKLSSIFDRPPIVVSPYDAELFGHWWYEGPEFLDLLVRKAYYDQDLFELISPMDYLRRHPHNQLAIPAASSWGEDGFWRVWLNEKNEWIYRHLHMAQERMTDLARGFASASALEQRAISQAGRELLLAQASDWPFILRTGTSPEYARKRVKEHLQRFNALHAQLRSGRIDEPGLERVEAQDNVFPELNVSYWT